ncbi:MAG: right-handed parallel beta-helix repeat-containing protein [Planctomycetota bacterium]
MIETLIFSMLLAVVGAPEAATITVDDDGPADYATIQEAVDNAVAGDTILVAAGFYPEEVIVPVSVAIVGSGMGDTLVAPATSRPGSGPGSQLGTTAWVFRVQASNVTIASLTILGDNPNIGGAFDARGGVITDFTTGTYDNLLVSGVEVDGVVYRGLYAAAGGSGHRFLSNDVHGVNTEPLDSVGIFFFGAVGEAKNNVVDDCSVGIGFQSGGGGLFEGNVLTGCDVGVLTNGSNTPVTIRDNDISGCAQGVQSIAPGTLITTELNRIDDCPNAIVCFGLGVGSNVIDDNELEGGALAGGAGIFATTDVSPFGFGTVRVSATNNEIVNFETGVVLHESLLDQTFPMEVTLSGDTSTYNLFADSGNFNLQLVDCDDDIDATGNFWGVAAPALIEGSIFHQVDDAALGLVDFASPVNLVVTVDDDGGADFTQINPAIQAVWPGGTVEVAPGFYQEDVVADRSLRLQGSGTDSDPNVGTVVQSTGASPSEAVIAVTANDVILENLRVDGFVPAGDNKIRRGIYGSSIDGLQVTDCVVHTAVSSIAYVFSTNGSFLRNECFDFGRNLNEGGGIFCFGSTATTGTAGNGNFVHDGPATAILFHQDSSGSAEGNRVANAGLGFLCNGCNAATTIRENEVRDSDQGYQAIASDQPVLYEKNTAFGCGTGFSLFPLSDQVHTYTDNYVDGEGLGTSGIFITTESSFGDSDVHAALSGNVFVGSQYGVQCDETASSQAFTLDADFDGSTSPNLFADNSSFAFFLDGCDDDVVATNNQFLTTDSAAIEARVFHKNDDSALGLVFFSGFLAPDPALRIDGFLDEDFTFVVTHVGAPSELAVFFVSGFTGSAPTPFGELLLGAPLIQIFTAPTGPLGLARTQLPIPSVIPGVTIYGQSLITTPTPFPDAVLTDRVQAVTR